MATRQTNSPQIKILPPSMKRELYLHLHLPPSNPQIDSNPNPSSVAAIETPEPDAGVSIAGADEDEALRRAATLSREEVLRRRSRRLRQLIGVYRQQFWALTEGVRAKHRSYYWDYGTSPVVEEDDGSSAARSESRAADQPPLAPDEWTGDSGRPEVLGLGLGFDGEKENGGCGSRERPSCAYSGCKAYAMPLTTFCHPHILMDQKQTLYKACGYAIKSQPTGQIICGKPVLRATVPPLCTVHLKKAQKDLSLALKKAGLNGTTPNRPAPKFHVIVAEYVRQIQTKRRKRMSEHAGDR